MQLDRRTFSGALCQLAAMSALHRTALAPSAACAAEGAAKPLFVATWNFGLPACEMSYKTLQSGGSILDAIEQGIRLTEADVQNDSVGIGGRPNAEGVLQLDACIMDGRTQKAGSVAALENYPHPISVARRVMEKTKHVMLVGPGAARFAKAEGFETAEMPIAEQKRLWQEWSAQQKKDKVPNHDTIALVGMDRQGNLAGGCSTSGLAYKLPGRVGDSPILGSGLYVDGTVGAAGATGIGENVMRFCATFLIVEMMRGGMDPTSACRATIQRIAKMDHKSPSELHINFLAIDKQGRYGAAGTDEAFQVAVVTNEGSKLIKPELVTE